MRVTPGRNLGVADGLIMVAATAAGLATSRMMAPDVTPVAVWGVLSTPPPDGWSIGVIAGMFAELGTILVMPCLVAWSLACLLMRMRGPRPARRRLVRQPGAMACLVAMVVVGLSATGGLAIWVMTEPNNPHRVQRLFGAVIFGSLQAGAAVLWCWVTMALCGRRAPEPTWLDRLGRLIGAAWVAVAMIHGYVTVTLWPY